MISFWIYLFLIVTVSGYTFKGIKAKHQEDEWFIRLENVSKSRSYIIQFLFWLITFSIGVIFLCLAVWLATVAKLPID